MRKVLGIAAVLALTAAPVSAQQVERSPFARAAVPAAEARPAAERTPSLHVTRQQMDAAVREHEQGRAAVTLDRNFWYLVGAVALGVIVASVILN
jgi:hypothetical protein